MNSSKFWLAALAVLSCAIANDARAQDIASMPDYARSLKITETIQPQGGSPFGENINLYTGTSHSGEQAKSR